MKNDRTLSNPAKLSIDAYISPSELRGAHNFASAAQPIMSLELQSGPPPLSPEQRALTQQNPQPVVERDNPSGTLPAVRDANQSSELVPHTIGETDFLIETRLTDPDPPFRPPSSWQNAEPSRSSERHWHWSERSTAAFLGFAAGVLIVVPLVFFLSMTSDQRLPQPHLEETDAPIAAAQPPASPVIIASASSGSWFGRITEIAAPTADPGAAQPPVQEAELRARAALAAGHVIEARAVLRIAASADTPRLWFVLAETYDPLVNADITKTDAKPPSQPGTSDQLTAADIKFARFYYQQALTHGVSAARGRLAALEKP